MKTNKAKPGDFLRIKQDVIIYCFSNLKYVSLCKGDVVMVIALDVAQPITQNEKVASIAYEDYLRRAALAICAAPGLYCLDLLYHDQVIKPEFLSFDNIFEPLLV